MSIGQYNVNSDTSEFNRISFLVRQVLALVRTATLVQVKAVSNHGGVSPVGTVDVLPLVNLLDGVSISSPHGTVPGLPYGRIQGGRNAVICDPCVGDIGIAVFADRDISVVKKTFAQANPGTFRRNSMADGIYLMTCVSNVTPEQFVRFLTDGDGNPQGIAIEDVNENTFIMDASGVTINGVLIDRSQNVSNVADLTSTNITSLAGGAKKVVLDGDPVSGGVVHSTATKTTAT